MAFVREMQAAGPATLSGPETVAPGLSLQRLEAAGQGEDLMLVCRDEVKKAIYVTPDGDLVADEAQAMRRELQGCIWQGTETLVLDLARVQTIDAIGLETIIAAYNRIRKSGGELVIENASRDLKDLFGLMMNGRAPDDQPDGMAPIG